MELFEGIQNLILGLQKRGYEVGIISSNSKENILAFLSKNNLGNIADKNILCSSRIFSKDKQLKKFLKNNQLKPSEIIYVGDENRDIIACKKVGVRIIWVNWGYDSIEVVENSNPDFLVNSPEEILKIV